MMDNILQYKKGNCNSGVGVLDKIVLILSYLAEEGPSEFSEIVSKTGISRSTAHRLLMALETHHLVVRTQEGYTLGSRIVGWGESSKFRLLVEASKPALVSLRDLTGESTQLYVKEGDKRVCLVSIEPAMGLKNTVPVGAVFPLEVGSAGKVISAWLGLGNNPEQDKLIRQQGWAESIAEREQGVASVSAPVLDPKGNLIAAVSVSGPISRLGLEPGKRLSQLVVAAAREIELAIRKY
ncbi:MULTISPECIES: IclR family transcriptional regulator [Geobacillus]|nr:MULTISPECIES: IclR family transcriptional regulator [Geobacillus]